MREEKILVRLFRKVADLIATEANHNPDFAARLESILAEIPGRKKRAPKEKRKAVARDLPDIFVEWKKRDQSDFLLWLRDQPLLVLRDLIKAHDLDAGNRATKWKDPEKLAQFILEQIRNRMSRGSAFLMTNPPYSS